jgi:archaellum biogenesis protein FlaJ (TadC family)
VKNERVELRQSQAIALAHLSMIAQAANGVYRPQPGEIDKREAMVASFIRTGQCVASDAGRMLVEILKALVEGGRERQQEGQATGTVPMETLAV